MDVMVLRGVLWGVFALFAGFVVWRSTVGYDLTLRYNECRVMLEEGLDPADVVAGRVESVGYRYFMDERPEMAHKQVIHAYPPWEYGVMLPLAAFPRSVVGGVYRLLTVVALLGVAMFSLRCMRQVELRDRVWEMAAPLSLLLFIQPLKVCADIGNFGLLITGAYLGAAWALSTRRPIALGLFWAAAMMKPQLGVWLAFPILFTRQWRAIPVAVGACCLLSLVPALYLGKSPVTLVLELADTSAQSAAVTQYGVGLFAFLHPTAYQGLIAPLNMTVCALVLGTISWWYRNSRDGLLLLAPVALCALWGSYSPPHDRMLLFVPMLLLIREGLRVPTTPKIRFTAIVGTLFIAGMCIVEYRLFRMAFNPWAANTPLSRLFILVDPCCWVLLTSVFCVFLQRIRRRVTGD